MELRIVKVKEGRQLQFISNKSTRFFNITMEQLDILYDLIGEELYNEAQGEKAVDDQSQ